MIAALLVGGYILNRGGWSETESTGGIETIDSDVAQLLPSRVGNNQIVRHKAFVLSYNDSHEQADWVFYKLTREMVTGAATRNTDFVEDKAVSSGTATTHDYSRTGFDRGHLCPSADIRNDEDAHDETYLMSNMSPQLHEFNAGIWNDLEMQTRSWAKKKGEVYVVVGPILKGGLDKIEQYKKGKQETARSHYNGVSVPKEFYKIIYSPKGEGRMIAYRLENKEYPENENPNKYCVSVDAIEKETGIDFFPGVPNEAELEKRVGGTSWWRE